MIFRGHTGYLVICRKGPNEQPDGTKEWTERGFQYPDELGQALDYIGYWTGLSDVYYRSALYDHRDKHTQEHISVVPAAVSDLDACPPDKLKVPASIEIETSPDRWQAAWLLDDVDMFDAEDISRRIAYEHRADGADVSGWDRGQVLRVPWTPNLKYPDALVRVVTERPGVYRFDDFTEYKPVAAVDGSGGYPLPHPQAVDLDKLPPKIREFVNDTSSTDRSGVLYSGIQALLSIGKSDNEILWVAEQNDSIANKYAERPGGVAEQVRTILAKQKTSDGRACGRFAHMHVGSWCKHVGCPNKPDWQDDLEASTDDLRQSKEYKERRRSRQISQLVEDDLRTEREALRFTIPTGPFLLTEVIANEHARGLFRLLLGGKRAPSEGSEHNHYGAVQDGQDNATE